MGREVHLFYLQSEALKSVPHRKLRLITGASAGSINALLTALSSCGRPQADPSRDLGFRSWVDTGYEDLFVPEKVDVLNVFSRRALRRAFERVRGVWERGLPRSCDIVLGMTTTHVDAYRLEMHEKLDLPRLTERFAFRIQGRGPGRPPKLSNYQDVRSPTPQPLLPFEPDADDAEAQARNFARIRDLIFASSAFPLAFGPRKLAYCLTSDLKEGARCTQPTREAWFLDGGLLDNTPLRFAHELVRLGLLRGRFARTRAIPARSRVLPVVSVLRRPPLGSGSGLWFSFLLSVRADVTRALARLHAESLCPMMRSSQESQQP